MSVPLQVPLHTEYKISVLPDYNIKVNKVQEISEILDNSS